MGMMIHPLEPWLRADAHDGLDGEAQLGLLLGDG